MKHLRQVVASQMIARHRISPELARYHVERMEAEEVWWRFRYYRAHGGWGLPLALALPKPAEPKTIPGETEGHGLLPLNAIAVRSPSGGGGGGVAVEFVLAVDVCREAENQVCSGGRRVPGM
jgi:hypothetical protein